jgi:hypothetical protein
MSSDKIEKLLKLHITFISGDSCWESYNFMKLRKMNIIESCVTFNEQCRPYAHPPFLQKPPPTFYTKAITIIVTTSPL